MGTARVGGISKLASWMAGARQIAVQFVNATAQVEHICGLALDNLDEAELRLAAPELSRQVDALRAANRLLSA